MHTKENIKLLLKESKTITEMDSEYIYRNQKAGFLISIRYSNVLKLNARHYIFIKERNRRLYRFLLAKQTQCLDSTDSESFQFSSIAEYEIIK